MEYEPISEFSAFSIYRRSLNIYLENLGPFLLLSILLNLPNYLISISFFDVRDPHTFLNIQWILTNTALSLFLNSFFVCILIKSSFFTLQQKKVPIIESVRVGLRYFLPVIIASILVLLLTLCGLVLLIIPGIIASVRLYMTVPALIFEGSPPVEAMKQSDELSDGYRMNIFMLSFVNSLALSIPNQIAAFMFVQTDSRTYFNILMVLVIVTSPMFAIAPTVAYSDARRLKGADVEEMAKIFE